MCSGEEVYGVMYLHVCVDCRVWYTGKYARVYMVNIVDVVGDQYPSVIITVWVPGCYVWIHIACEYGILCRWGSVCSQCLILRSELMMFCVRTDLLVLEKFSKLYVFVVPLSVLWSYFRVHFWRTEIFFIGFLLCLIRSGNLYGCWVCAHITCGYGILCGGDVFYQFCHVYV